MRAAGFISEHLAEVWRETPFHVRRILGAVAILALLAIASRA